MYRAFNAVILAKLGELHPRMW